MRNLMWKAMSWREARRAEEGQTVVEYALVVAGISVVLVVLLVGLGSDVIETAQTEIGGVWTAMEEAASGG